MYEKIVNSDFYIIGKPLHPYAESYIERKADAELERYILSGYLCWVLTPHQTGKTSLTNRTAKRLREQQIITAVITLEGIDEKIDATGWYFDVFKSIVRELRIEINIMEWWFEVQNHLTPSLRFKEFLTEILLKSTKNRIVIFMDEIDTIIDRPFKEDFFAMIRSIHNAQTTSQEEIRLNFVFIGVTRPLELIKKKKRKPFNIGQLITLSDFTFNEAKLLSRELGTDAMQSEKILKKILEWTGGHPYLTQKACKAFAENRLMKYESEVDQLLNEVFLAHGINEVDNLHQVRRRITEDKKSKALLKLYLNILNGEKSINNDPNYPLLAILRLSGLIIIDDNRNPKVRNRIYSSVFTHEWAQEELKNISKSRFKTILPILLSITPLFSLSIPRLQEFIFDNVLSASLAYSTYLFTLFVLFYAKNTWSQILTKLANRTTEYLEQRILFRFSKFYSRYLQELVYQNRFFSIKGTTIQNVFSLRLQNVFVTRKLVLYSNGTRHSGDSKLDSETDIWDYLESNEEHHRVLVILGKPGAGKTALLQHVILQIASKKASGKFNKCIPFLVPLSSSVVDILNPPDGIVDLANVLQNKLKKFKPPSAWCHKVLEQYGDRCIIMFEGLDEIALEEDRAKIARWIEQQTERYPDTKFIITSRHYGYINNTIHNATVLEIKDFTFSQIKDYIGKWYLATEMAATGEDDAGISNLAETYANKLLETILSSDVLFRLARNPLLLTMIALVHRNMGNLEVLRAYLYSEVCKVLLGRRDAPFKADIKVSIFQKHAILQKLALEIMKNERASIKRQEAIQIISPLLQSVSLRLTPVDAEIFLDNIINQSGLLVEVERKKEIRFVHLTYQEYLAAVEIKSATEDNANTERIDLTKKINESWWHETILLYSAMSDATQIIRACLNPVNRTLETLRLAYEISQEAMQIEPRVRIRLQRRLVHEADSDDINRQEIASGLVLDMRVKKMVGIYSEIKVDPFYISQVEYQSYINATSDRPDHWSEWHFKPGTGLTPIVGVRRRDAEKFAHWLTRRFKEFEGGRSSFRLAKQSELLQVPTENEIDDPTFQRLADPNIGTWSYDREGMVWLPQATQTTIREITYTLGENEILRISIYHQTTTNRIEELTEKCELIDKHIDLVLRRLHIPNRQEALTGLPDAVDSLVNEEDALKTDFKVFTEFSSKRGFAIEIYPNRIERLDSELIRLKRERDIRAGNADYSKTPKGEIIDYLAQTSSKMSRFKEELSTLKYQAFKVEQDLYDRLSQDLRLMAAQAIDLDIQMSFLNTIHEVRLSTDEIRRVKERSNSKNYQKARSELLALAEYYLRRVQNDDARLNEIIRAFWAIFFIEQRSKNEFPAWEGIRLVKETKLPKNIDKLLFD